MAWSPSGDEVWFTGVRGGDAMKLYAVSLGGEERVVAHVPESLELFDIGKDGRVLLAHSLQRRVTMGLRPGTREEQVLSWLDLSFLHDLATDGTAILFHDLDGLRFRRTDGSPPIRLARAERLVGWGALSPDSRWVLTKLSGSPDSPLMILPTGVGEPRRLGALRDVAWAGWLPRGQVAYAVRTAGGDGVYAHDPATGKSRAIASRPPGSLSLAENGPRISPDGRWIAAPTGNEISIFPVEGGALRRVPGNHDGCSAAAWSSRARAHTDRGAILSNRSQGTDPRAHMTTPFPEEITQLLRTWSEGDTAALDRLMPLVYAELRRMAGRYMAPERRGHTIQTTALVHEAYLRLVDQRRVQWRDRNHFFAIAAQLMRRILVDHARKRRNTKRGGDAVRLPLDAAATVSSERAAEVVALDDALKSLSGVDERKARVVELRFFGGLSIEETAGVLGVSPGTVMRDWTLAKAWLRREVSGTGHDEP